jgi:galactonate dehydratase
LTDVPFAIGEEFASKWQFLPYIERGIMNYARVDICNVGGFTESMKVAGWAESHYIDLMPHNPLGPICTAASVHLSAAVPNFSWLEVNMERAENPDLEIFPEQVLFEGNGYAVPDKPGLGVEVDESTLNVPFKFWDPPHLHRRDGSVTNW